MTTKAAKRKQSTIQNGSADGEKKQRQTNTSDPASNKENPDNPAPVAVKRKKASEPETQEEAQDPSQDIEYVKNFRQKLKSGVVAIDAIRHFIQQSHANPSYITEYIRTSGTLKNLMEVLAVCDPEKLNDIADLFHLLHLVLIEAANYDATQATQAAKCAKSIMSDYKPVIVKVLRDRGEHSLTCRAAGFRILKAVLLVDAATYGKEILRQMDVVMPELEMHKCRETASSATSGGSAESLRTVFIDFNLAFLIDTPTEIVRLWLSRVHLVHSLTTNLVFDQGENVALVMKSLRQYVLECPAVDKYLYRTVFTTDVLKALVNVYEWVGPDKEVPKEQLKQAIFDATEEVVLPLLTSRRYFLVPHSIDVNRASHRHKHILLALKNSQLHDHQRRLVMRLFESCPEVLPAVLENFGSLLKTKKEGNRGLVLDILCLHKPEEIVAGFEAGITAKLVSHFIVKSTLPRTVLEYVGVAMGSHKHNIPFCLQFLCTMITRCEQYLQAIQNRRILDQFDMKKIKFDVINQILALFPSIDRIMTAMATHRDDRSVQRTNVALEHAMDILLVCIRSFPAYIESSSFITTYRDILKPAYRTPSMEHFYLNYEFKAIKVVIALEPQSVSFGSKLFPSVLKLVAKVYLNGSKEMQREATELLLALFRNTTLFGHRGTEVEFWFQALYDTDATLVPELVNYLAQATRQASAQLSQQSASASQADHSLIDEAFIESEGIRKADLDMLFARVEQEDEQQQDPGQETTMVTIPNEMTTENTQLELPVADNFFMYMFHKDRKHPAQFQRYLDAVLLRYFHYLPHPEIVQRALRTVAEDKQTTTSSSLVKYIHKWMTGKERALDEDWGVLSKLSAALLGKDKTLKLDPQDANQWRNIRGELIHLLHETIFCLSRWISAGNLTQQHLDVASHYTNRLLDALLTEGTLSESDTNELMSSLFLQRPVLFQQFTIIVQDANQRASKAETTHRLVTSFVYELMQRLQHLPSFDRATTLYSNKIVTELIRTSTKQVSQEDNPATTTLDGALVEKLLGIFELNERHCVTLLKHYALLPVRAFLQPKTNERTYHYQQLCLALEKLANVGGTRGGYHLTEQTVRGLVRLYMECVRSSDSEAKGLEELETALHAYLSTFTHSIAQVDVQLFEVVFENRQRVTKSLVKLATFLLSRDSRFDAPLLELIGKHTSKKELVYPLLNVAFRRSVLSAASLEQDSKLRPLVSKLYAEFKGGIQKMLEKPHKAAVIYRENTIANETLVRLCMPRNECVDFARKKLRIEAVEPFQLKVLMEIYGSALIALKDDANSQTMVYGNVFGVLLQCFEVLFRSVSSAEYFLRQEASIEKLNELVLALYEWSKQSKRHKALQEMSFGSVTTSANWNTFCKTCLKLGIDMPRSPLNSRRYDDRLHVLPKLMGVLVDLFYANDATEQLEDIERYYDWALSHTNFLRVLLTQYEYSPKTYLVYLLLILARKNPNVVNRKHVPLLLGAYGATLTDTNRYILALIQHYEQSGVEMHEFRPFLWGETAIKHFSLESNTGTTNEDQQQQHQQQQRSANGRKPAPQRGTFRINNMEVFSLLSKDKIAATIQNFPVWRRLDASAQLPELNFDNILSSIIESATLPVGHQPVNAVERYVELGQRKQRQELLETLTLKSELRSTIYDPAFLIPMLGYLFSPENPDMLNLAGRIGALSLPFLCLANSDERMRLAAGSVILRIRAHLEQTRRFIDSKFWLHLFGAVQRGMAGVKVHKPKEKKKDTAKAEPLPKTPFLSTIFIAETINLLPDVLSPLHGPMTRYIIHREAFDFRAIPNFMALFHSADVKHNVQRSFILETIFHGIKTHEDFGVLRASPIIRVMLNFYASSLSNRELNILILNSLNALTKIPKSCEVLVNAFGFLSWLHEKIDTLESFEFDTIEAFLGMLNNCWYSIQIIAELAGKRDPSTRGKNQKKHSATSASEQRRAAISFHRSVLVATLKFLPLLSTRSSSKTLLRFLHLLDRTTSTRFAFPRLLALVGEPVLRQMMEYFEKMFADHLWCVRYVRQCGTTGCDDDATIARKLVDAGTDRTTVAIVVSLRRFVIRWQHYQKTESTQQAMEVDEEMEDQGEVKAGQGDDREAQNAGVQSGSSDSESDDDEDEE
uniref:Putative nucleolar pre-ribosomal-associated protein 1 n=1 Tax=Anopheles darlingi TaxID=43151 RepID=A0A2M4CRG4_ANODA